MKLENINQIITLAGSIGVSLLWLKELFPTVNVVLGLPILAVASLLVVALASAAYLLFRIGYSKIVGDRGSAVKVIYISAMLAILISALTFAFLWIYVIAASIMQGTILY
jgi:hypothetical protein